METHVHTTFQRPIPSPLRKGRVRVRGGVTVTKVGIINGSTAILPHLSEPSAAPSQRPGPLPLRGGEGESLGIAINLVAVLSSIPQFPQ